MLLLALVSAESRADAVAAARVSAVTTVFGYSGLGLDVSARFMRRAGIDATIGYADSQHNHAGMSAEVLGQLFLFDGTYGLTLGLGPSLLTGTPEFGEVAFLQSEIAFEYRNRGGLAFLIGGGPFISLNNSGKASCPDQGWFSCMLWINQYHAGDVNFRVRLAVGLAF